VIRLKAIGIVALIWLAFFYFAIAIYGRFSSVGTSAWYSGEVDATCIVEKRIDQMAMSCMPGNRLAGTGEDQ
jgi:hypothetical protein